MSKNGEVGEGGRRIRRKKGENLKFLRIKEEGARLDG